MQIPVLVEEVGGRFRARCGEPFALSADGDTHDAAVRNLQRVVDEKLRTARLDTVVVAPQPAAPVDRTAEIDHPWYQEYLQAIADYRREKDEAEGIEYDPAEPPKPANGVPAAGRGA